MESLQLTCFKQLLDNYSWDEESLISLREQIDKMLIIAHNNFWINYFSNLDVENRYSKFIYNSSFSENVNKQGITISYDKMIFWISKFQFYEATFILREIGNNVYWCFSGDSKNYRINAYTDDIHHLTVDIKPGETEIEIGLFLWEKYFLLRKF